MKLSAERLAEIRKSIAWYDGQRWVDRAVEYARELLAHIDAQAAEIKRIQGHVGGTCDEWMHKHDNLFVELDSAKEEIYSLRKVFEAAEKIWPYLLSHYMGGELSEAIKAHIEKYPERENS